MATAGFARFRHRVNSNVRRRWAVGGAVTFRRAVLITLVGEMLIAGIAVAALFAYYRPTVEWAFVDIREVPGSNSVLRGPIVIAAVVLAPASLLWLWKRRHV